MDRPRTIACCGNDATEMLTRRDADVSSVRESAKTSWSRKHSCGFVEEPKAAGMRTAGAGNRRKSTPTFQAFAWSRRLIPTQHCTSALPWCYSLYGRKLSFASMQCFSSSEDCDAIYESSSLFRFAITSRRIFVSPARCIECCRDGTARPGHHIVRRLE